MEQVQGPWLLATWRRNFTRFIPKVSTGVLLTEHKAESLDALPDITYLFGSVLKVHTLANWHSHDEQSGTGGSRGVPEVNSGCLIGSHFSPLICRFFGTSSFVEAHFHQVCILSNVDKRKWDEVQEAECLCLDMLVEKCFSSFVHRAWCLKSCRAAMRNRSLPSDVPDETLMM